MISDTPVSDIKAIIFAIKQMTFKALNYLNFPHHYIKTYFFMTSKTMRNFFLYLTPLLLPSIVYASDPLAGSTWKTIDDKTNQPAAIVKFTEIKDGQFTASIQKSLLPNEEKRCTSCQGKYHNQSLVGLVIVKDLKKLKLNEYGEGKILDPQNGKTYSFSAKRRIHTVVLFWRWNLYYISSRFLTLKFGL